MATKKITFSSTKDSIFVTIDYKRFEVPKKRYIQAKTKDLINFGYPDLTEATIEKELENLLAGGKWTDVVGGFIEADKPSYSRAEPKPQPKVAPKKSKSKRSN